MANIDYEAVLADLEDQKAKFNTAMDSAITGIKTVLAMRAQSRPAAQTAPPDKKRLITKTAPRGAFGRDPNEPTIADRAAAIMLAHGGPIGVKDLQIRLKESGKDVSENVLRDVLTRKDKKTQRFKKHSRGMFKLNPHPNSNGNTPPNAEK